MDIMGIDVIKLVTTIEIGIVLAISSPSPFILAHLLRRNLQSLPLISINNIPCFSFTYKKRVVLFSKVMYLIYGTYFLMLSTGLILILGPIGLLFAAAIAAYEIFFGRDFLPSPQLEFTEIINSEMNKLLSIYALFPKERLEFEFNRSSIFQHLSISEEILVLQFLMRRNDIIGELAARRLSQITSE